MKLKSLVITFVFMFFLFLSFSFVQGINNQCSEYYEKSNGLVFLYDTNDDGKISLNEMNLALKENLGFVKKEEISSLVMFSLSKCKYNTISTCFNQVKKNYQKVLNHYDTNKDGILDERELMMANEDHKAGRINHYEYALALRSMYLDYPRIYLNSLSGNFKTTSSPSFGPYNCGDGICNFGEAPMCPQDCPNTTCGDGWCNPDMRDLLWCPQECGSCSRTAFPCPPCYGEYGGYGDICGNGNVDSCGCDTSRYVSYVTGRRKPTLAELRRGDVNGNGRIDAQDYCLVIYLAELGMGRIGNIPGSRFYTFPVCNETNKCGNLKCESGENEMNCPQDCGTGTGYYSFGLGNCSDLENNTCGNGKCDKADSWYGCRQECQGTCGNGVCDPGEQYICPQDCQGGNTCGNNQCDIPGDYLNGCPQECSGGTCGNNQCDPQDWINCPQECQGTCGNGVCDPGEQYICPQDCQGGNTCGNNQCDIPGDYLNGCPQECSGGTCGNNQCDPQDFLYCPQECGFNSLKCGNGVCDQGEEIICPQDCINNSCGNNRCDWNDWINCPEECQGRGANNNCGNGKCDPEDFVNCPKECVKLVKSTCGNNKCDKGDIINCPEECVLGEKKIYTLHLKKGWNLISSPVGKITLNNISGCEFESPLWNYDGFEYVRRLEIKPMEGYWVKVKEDCTATVKGYDLSFPLKLHKGWNLISSSKSWNEIKGNCVSVRPSLYSWNGNSYFKISFDQKLNDFEGYWVKVKESCEIAE